MAYKTSSEVKRRYNVKTYDRIEMSVRKDDVLNKEELTRISQEKGFPTLTAYIMYCVRKELGI